MSEQETSANKHPRESLSKETQVGKQSSPKGVKSSNEELRKQEASTQPNEAQPKVVINEAKIFSKKASIFAANEERPKMGNIFANRKSVNLFNLNSNQPNQKPINIFSLASNSQPLAKSQREDDLLSISSQGPEDNHHQQDLKQPEQKVMKYAYQEKMEKIADFRVVKFRSATELAAKEGNMLLSLEKQKQGKYNIIYLILRNQATKITLYQSFLLQNTKPQHFSNREQSMKLWTIRSKKKDQTFIPQKQIVKIQFQSIDQAKRFEQNLETKLQTKPE